MRWTSWAALALCAGLVTGCGDKTDKAGATGDDSAKGSASKVAAEDKVRCPARVKTPGRAAGAPVDDVLGIRPGLTLDEAINIVRCEDKTLEVKVAERGFDLNTYGRCARASTRPQGPELSGEEALEQMRQRQMDRSLNRSVTRPRQPSPSRPSVFQGGNRHRRLENPAFEPERILRSTAAASLTENAAPDDPGRKYGVAVRLSGTPRRS